MKAAPVPKVRDSAVAQARLDPERWVGGALQLPLPARVPGFGVGRHRRYYELADVGWEHPPRRRVKVIAGTGK